MVKHLVLPQISVNALVDVGGAQLEVGDITHLCTNQDLEPYDHPQSDLTPSFKYNDKHNMAVCPQALNVTPPLPQ